MTVLSPEFPLQTSDVACIDINKNDMWFVGNTIERSWYKLGNATAECYKNLEVSQSLVDHSSEKRGLRSTFLFGKMLQNLLYL